MPLNENNYDINYSPTTIMHYTVMDHTIMYYTVMYHTVMDPTVMDHTVMYQKNDFPIKHMFNYRVIDYIVDNNINVSKFKLEYKFKSKYKSKSHKYRVERALRHSLKLFWKSLP